jgi:hypothetical protein
VFLLMTFVLISSERGEHEYSVPSLGICEWVVSILCFFAEKKDVIPSCVNFMIKILADFLIGRA